MALIEGLPEDRWAIAHKTHHCLVDGVGSVDVAYLLLDTEPNPPEHTSLNVPIGSSRRFAVVNRPLAELKTIRRGLGGSINDVVLAACTTGLRRLFLARGEQPPRRGLRAMVPMNVRRDSERLTLGNRVTS